MVCHEWEENQHYCCWMCECWWHLHSTYGDLECEDDAFWYGSWWSPWYHAFSDNRWIDQELFDTWFHNLVLLYAPSVRPLLLSMDGHSNHYCLETIQAAAKQKVIQFTIPPNTTYLSQPLDKVFLVHWKRFTHTRSTYARNQLARGQLTRGQLSWNQLSRNQLARDQLARDQLARDQLFKRSTPRSQLLLDQLLWDQLRKINSVCTVLFRINVISSLTWLHPLCGRGTF